MDIPPGQLIDREDNPPFDQLALLCLPGLKGEDCMKDLLMVLIVLSLLLAVPSLIFGLKRRADYLIFGSIGFFAAAALGFHLLY